MFLDPISQPTLPTLLPDPIHSFYPYPVLPRSKVHQSLLSPSSNTTQKQFQSIQPGPGPSTEQNAKSRNAKQRAARRALMGRRPAGVALGREAEELSDEEASLEDEKQNINMFGHRFLLPFGRRHTQMEMDAAPSPTPSEPDHERRQEDQNMGSPTSLLVGGDAEEAGAVGGGEDEVDLDASVEDLDAGELTEDEGGSGDEGEEGMEEE